ncbi:hypothetical protein BIY37_11210 [Candidatus Brocadia sapporoensis]|uniref:Uncharacterized protein n=1 Tax=Candidatus Brocadia sapporoensis TaxID=392547 RepID=A0A1V6LXL8_9BACT|nr:hypothetical protein BIY37_11210 [Candidatus Brocadia sapporoensis]TVL94829.1 MAG: hypothetical protein CV082_13330 [Candidatus Brocadia sp. BL1]
MVILQGEYYLLLDMISIFLMPGRASVAPTAYYTRGGRIRSWSKSDLISQINGALFLPTSPRSEGIFIFLFVQHLLTHCCMKNKNQAKVVRGRIASS